MGQVAPPSGGDQPTEKGIRKVAKELDISPREVRRAEKIASITPEAKEAAKAAGIDDNQSKLLKVAAAPAEKQVKAVEVIRERRKQKCKPSITAQHRNLLNRADNAISLATLDDWSYFKVDEEIAKKVEQAAEAWLALAIFIRKLKDGHKVEPDFLNRAKIAAAEAATP